MAFEFVDNVAKMNAGDYASVAWNFGLGSEETHVMGAQEYLVFSIRAVPTKDSPLLCRIQSAPGSNRIIFTPQDTEELSIGKYSADVELILDGDVDKPITIWPRIKDLKKPDRPSNWENFVIVGEVSRRADDE